MSDIRIDDDGFLVGDGEQQRTEAENVLMREIKADTTTIVNLLKGTVKLQRETLEATQNNSSPKPNGGNNGGNGSNNQQPKVNLVHPNRAAPTPLSATPLSATPLSATPLPPTARPNQQGAGSNNQSPNNGNSAGQGAPDTARINRQRDANGRFVGSGDNAENTESNNAQGRGNRDSRGRFTGGDGSGQNAAERSAVSRITDSLKDLNNTLNVNVNTDRIDPTIDAIKELGSIASVGIDAGKKALSVSNTLIAKPAMALGRGIKGLFKPKTDAINSPVAWYKRIWLTLRQGNRQDQTQHAQEQRRLDELVRGQGQRGSSDSSFLMMLGLGIAALLAAIKNIKFPSLDDIKDKFKGLGTDNQSPVPVVKVPKLNSTIIQANPALKWLSETKVGQTVSKFLKRLPFISSAIEAAAGGINAVNIANDANLTEEQKQRKQSENAGRTGGAIVGGLGGVTAGAALGTKLGLMTGNPIIAAVGGIVGGLVGGWLGTDAGRIVGNKIGGWVDDLRKADIVGKISQAWTSFIEKITPSFSGIKESIVDFLKPKAEKPIDIVKNAPTKKMSLGGKAVPIVGDVYADKNSELYKNYQLWKEADTDGNGIITVEEFKKSKYPEQNPALLKKFEPVTPKPTAKKATKPTAKKATKPKAKKATKPTDKSTQAYFDANKDYILDATQRFNADPVFLTATAYKESRFKGGDLKNPESTATGMFQMVEDTWAWQIAKSKQPEALPYKADAIAYLKDREKGMLRIKRREKYKTLLAARNDNKLNSLMGAQLSIDAMQSFKKAGINNPSLAELYAYHHDGNPSRVVAARKGDIDAQNQLAEWQAKLDEGKTYAKGLSYSQSPTTTPQQPIAKAETIAPPTLKSAPVNAMPIQNVNAVSQVQVKEIQTRLNNTPTPIKVSIQKPIVSQNVSDRGIAHIVTGGIGEAM
mgnify:FL=1